MKLERALFAPLILSASVALVACARDDDATLTARAQARVNQAMSPDSNVQVVVRDGHATLTGLASTEAMRARADQVARGVEGIEAVDDKIATAPTLTGATVPR